MHHHVFEPSSALDAAEYYSCEQRAHQCNGLNWHFGAELTPNGESKGSSAEKVKLQERKTYTMHTIWDQGPQEPQEMNEWWQLHVSCVMCALGSGGEFRPVHIYKWIYPICTFWMRAENVNCNTAILQMMQFSNFCSAVLQTSNMYKNGYSSANCLYIGENNIHQ